MSLNKTQLLFLVILIEGYVVLACELLAIRELIPFVGSGTETVSIVISAVLLPLAIGYHFGGSAYARNYRRARNHSKQFLSVRKLLLKNILSALFILTLGLSYIFMEIFFGLLSVIGLKHRLLQTFIYSGLFLAYPVFLLAQTVPLISNYFSRKKLSEVTGKMLFFSTTGSFLGSVFSTIILMTFIGVHNTVIVTLSLLCILGILLVRKKMSYEVMACLVTFALLYLLNGNHTMRELKIISNNAYNMVALQEMPADEALILNANRSLSSKISKDPEKDFEYTKYIRSIFLNSEKDTAPRDILVIGAGGFTVGLYDKINHYTYVDIDKALKDVSEKHFLPHPLPPTQKFVAASARAFVHSDNNKYDLILIDTYTNLISLPMECTTREFLLDVKKLLKENGVVIANVISSPSIRDKFTARYNNTFASVFPIYTRQVIGAFDPWTHQSIPANVLYIYYNNEFINDTVAYTDDKNTYSLDRN